ncbi:MAG: RsmE family RNA methyltransferase [Acidobacteriota bacterium]
MVKPRARRRLRLSPEALHSDPVEIFGPPLRHLHVLRLRAGDRVYLFDGQGREIEAELVEVGRTRGQARLLREIEGHVEPPLRCWLVQGLPARLSRMDLIVRQVTEMGVECILPVLAQRSQRPAGSDALRRRQLRWQRIASAAASQSRRQQVPGILAPVSVEELAWGELPPLVLLFDPGGPAGLRQALAAPAPANVALMVGPEGGWSPEERRQSIDHGAVPISLGPRVLRTDTASAAALAILLHCWGDLGC